MNESLSSGEVLQQKAISQYIEYIEYTEESYRKATSQGNENWAKRNPEEFRRNLYNSIVAPENVAALREITETYIRHQNGVELDSVQRAAINQHIEKVMEKTISEDSTSYAATHPEQYRTAFYNSLVNPANENNIKNITDNYIRTQLEPSQSNRVEIHPLPSPEAIRQALSTQNQQSQSNSVEIYPLPSPEAIRQTLSTQNQQSQSNRVEIHPLPTPEVIRNARSQQNQR